MSDLKLFPQIAYTQAVTEETTARLKFLPLKG